LRRTTLLRGDAAISRRIIIDENRLREILRRCANDGLSIDDAVGLLRDLPYQDLGFAKVDHHRAIRTGFPEVVFGEGKTPNQTATIAQAILQQSDVLLVTRASQEMYSAVLAGAPDATYDEMARTVIVDRREHREHLSGVLVLCAGTADLPVATEAAITAELMGCEVERVFDVGVAGIHRLLDQLETLQRARVVIAVAGMEGALPSVVGGLVRAPVIAVPTSIGYGASFQGLAALLAMLNSCAPGVAVVNIDNGFGAGYLAAQIIHVSHDSPSPQVDNGRNSQPGINQRAGS
jgi:NCAIR mutase (PurE)-related protein|tara:strand:- start:298 stop:1173 length:876 start_codon:yes stop_codon:yes gene_type:complete